MTLKPSEQCLEAARQAVWQMLSIAEVLGSQIDEAVIRRAAPGPSSAAACRLASTLASATLGQIEVVSMILAGGYDEASIAALEADQPAAGAPTQRSSPSPPTGGRASVTVAPPTGDPT